MTLAAKNRSSKQWVRLVTRCDDLAQIRCDSHPRRHTNAIFAPARRIARAHAYKPENRTKQHEVRLCFLGMLSELKSIKGVAVAIVDHGACER